MADRLTSSPAAERSELLVRLVYELLDAHTDTERLANERANDLQWCAHLNYLRDLQRVGREILTDPVWGRAIRTGRHRAGTSLRQ